MQNLEELIVLHCSPTLALLKPASMFTCPFDDREDIKHSIEKQNQCLNKKGIYLRILAKRKTCFLIFVFQKDLLEQHLCNSDIASFLADYGYSYTSSNEALDILKMHMRNQDFPHEIGVFLGYPLHDVISFIEHKGKDYQDVGYWKVYHNLKEAQCLFARFKRCVETYQINLHNGILLENLVII